MPNDTALKSPIAPAREIAHTVSPGTVDAGVAASQDRQRRDGVAGHRRRVHPADDRLRPGAGGEGLGEGGRRQLRAAVVDHARRHGCADAGAAAVRSRRHATTGPTPGSAFNSTVVDPLADVIANSRAARRLAPHGADENKVVDPLADVMKDIRTEPGRRQGRAAAEERRATLPFGGDKWGRDIIAKTIKGSETSIFVGLAAAARRRVHRHGAGRVRRLLRTLGGRRAELVLQRVQFHSLPAADPRRRGGAAAEGNVHDRPDPGPHRLERRVPPDPRRVPEAQGTRIRDGRRCARRIEQPQDVPAHLPQRLARRAGAAVDPHRRIHQGRGHPVVPGLRRAGRRRVVGLDAERGAERTDPRQVVAAGGGDHRDGHARHRVQPLHRRAARRARSQAQGPDGH